MLLEIKKHILNFNKQQQIISIYDTIEECREKDYPYKTIEITVGEKTLKGYIGLVDVTSPMASFKRVFLNGKEYAERLYNNNKPMKNYMSILYGERKSLISTLEEPLPPMDTINDFSNAFDGSLKLKHIPSLDFNGLTNTDILIDNKLFNMLKDCNSLTEVTINNCPPHITAEELRTKTNAPHTINFVVNYREYMPSDTARWGIGTFGTGKYGGN